jgi:predicted HicB family RNase H-like nuclease
MNVITYKGYKGSFEYDPEADIFHGDVLNIADVVTSMF